MSLMRPGIKIRFWSPKNKNSCSVVPPGLLRLAAALSIVSVVGVIVYSVAIGTTSVSHFDIERDKAIYIALLHFVLPVCIFYAITTNSPASRILLTIYFVTLYIATLIGKGLLGELPYPFAGKVAVATLVLVLLLAWLYRSPKMRCYYCLVSGNDVPDELAAHVSKLTDSSWLTPKTRLRVEWILDHLETLVILGFIVAVFVALNF